MSKEKNSKLTYKDYRITRELACYSQLSFQAKHLLGYLLMTRKRILYCGADYLSEVFGGVCAQTIGNWFDELEKEGMLTRHKKEGKRYYLTIIHDLPYLLFNYDINKIRNNWNYIEKDPDYEQLKYNATRKTKFEPLEVDVLALYKQIYGKK